MSYERAGVTSKKRLIGSVDALEKSGKTHFALTAPAPIAYIGLDWGDEGVIDKVADSKEIWKCEHRVPIVEGMSLQQVSDAAQKCWKAVRKDYHDALTDENIKTIIVDTGTEMWDLCRLAWFGKLTEVMPHQYSKPNAEFRNLIRAPFEFNKHAIFLHKLKDEYIGNNKTGKYKRSGMSDVGFLVQVVARAWKDPTVQEVPDKFHVEITDCRFHPEFEGLDLSGTDCDFPHLAALVIDGDPEKWEEYA